MNYYERHLGDYARDTAHLTMMEHGAYGLLLDRYYATERGIPADQAHRVARARTREERAAVDAVLQEFFVLDGDTWTHSRVQWEIGKAQTKIEAARTNGRRGGRPKKNPPTTQPKPNGFPLGSVSETQDKALQTPDTSSNTTPPTPPDGGALGLDGFALFWSAYPEGQNKVAMDQCRRRWDRDDLDAKAAEIVAHVKAMVASGRWTKDGGAYVPAPLTYLRQARYATPAQPGDAPAIDWRETRSGIEAMGQALLLGVWDEEAFDHGKGEPFQSYRRRVLAAVECHA